MISKKMQRTVNRCVSCLIQVVAVKQLDRNGFQGNREFLVEVLMLSLLHNPNLVNLVGYCAEGPQRLLVYEFMAKGSLEDHLLGNFQTLKFYVTAYVTRNQVLCVGHGYVSRCATCLHNGKKYMIFARQT